LETLEDRRLLTIDADDIVGYRVEVTDLYGDPIQEATVGQTVQLRGYVQDLRGPDAVGVFSAGTDVLFTNPGLATLRYGETQRLVDHFVSMDPFTLTLDGETTGPIDVRMGNGAEAIRTALEALPGVAPGDVWVNLKYGDLNYYDIQFRGNWGERDVAPMIVAPQVDPQGQPALEIVDDFYPADLSDPGTFASAFQFQYPFGWLPSATDGGPGHFAAIGATSYLFSAPEPKDAELLFFLAELQLRGAGQMQFAAAYTDDQFAETLTYDGAKVPVSNIGIHDPVTLHIVQPVPGITVAPGGRLITNEQGRTATFSVVLDSLPTAPVTVPLMSSDLGEGTVWPASLTFTPGDALIPQTVTVTGVGDAEADPYAPYLVQTLPAISSDADYQGLDAADVTLVNLDEDLAAVPYAYSQTGAAVDWRMAPGVPPPAVFLTGTSTIELWFAGQDGAAVDLDGDGLDEVAGRLAQLDLEGRTPGVGSYTVRLSDPGSWGWIEETVNSQPGILDLPPYAHGVAQAVLDGIRIEVTGLDPQGPLTSGRALRFEGLVTRTPAGQGDVLNLVNGPIALIDSSGATYLQLEDIALYPVSQPTSISGQKWHDLNADGVHDAGEPGLDGWVIALTDPWGRLSAVQLTHSLDGNGDGLIDPETERGLYQFDDVLPGNYLLLEVNQAGWARTVPARFAPAPPVTNGPGADWIATLEASEAFWRQYVLAEFDWDLDGMADEETILDGFVTLAVDDPQDPGSGELDLAAAEIQSSWMYGLLQDGRWLLIETRDPYDPGTLPPSGGEFREQATDPTRVDASLDLLFQMEVYDSGGDWEYPGLLSNPQPLRIAATLDRFPPTGIVWDSQGAVDLVDPDDQVRGRLLRLRTAYGPSQEIGPVYELTLALGDDKTGLDFANVEIGPAPQGQDAGDAPGAGYHTLLADDGAVHTLDGVTFLGLLADAEPDGQPTPAADGDDAHGFAFSDEDGVQFVTPLGVGREATIQVDASASGYLNAWIDFNADGQWDDAAGSAERIFLDEPLMPGPNLLTFAVPDFGAGGDLTPRTYARFRFTSYETGGQLSFRGPARDGEVEDYAVAIDYPEVVVTAENGSSSMRVAPTDYQRDHEYSGINAWSVLHGDVSQDHLVQQWFWYRLGDSGPESPLDALPLTDVVRSATYAPQDTLTLRYGGALDPLAAEVTYVLRALPSSDGSTQVAIEETVTVTNQTGGPADVHWFEYTDLDLDPAFGENRAEWVAPGHIRQQSSILSTVDVQVVDGPLPDRWEIAAAADLAQRLRDGAATELANAQSPYGPADVGQAFQWDLSLAAGADTVIRKVKTGRFQPVVLPGKPIAVIIRIIIWVDPAIAVGYDYDAAGGPNFDSVTPPLGYGDNRYSLHLPDGSGGYQAQGIELLGGETYDLTQHDPAGLSRFQPARPMRKSRPTQPIPWPSRRVSRSWPPARRP